MSKLSILYTTPSPTQQATLIQFDTSTLLYGVASAPLPSSSAQTTAVSHVRLSTGMLVVVYRQGHDFGAFKNLYLATYTDAAGWANVDTLIVNALPGSDQVVLVSLFADGNDRVHIVYQDQASGSSTFTTSYVNWTLAGGLQHLQLLGTDINQSNWGWTRGLFLSGSDTICLFIRKADSKLYEYTGTPSANPVFTQTVVATSAEQPDGAAPLPVGMLLNSAGTKRYAIWWGSGTRNTIQFDSNSGAGWSGSATPLLNLSATDWQITSPVNGSQLLNDTPTITVAFDITGRYPNAGFPSNAETAVYMGPGGVNNLVDVNSGTESAEMVVSLINVTGSPVYSSGSLFLVLDYSSPPSGNERISIWKSTDHGLTWSLQDDAHAPSRLPSSVVFISGVTPGGGTPGGGGGSGGGCMVQACAPRRGQLWRNFCAVFYRDTCGATHEFHIDPRADEISQVARELARVEGYDARTAELLARMGLRRRVM